MTASRFGGRTWSGQHRLDERASDGPQVRIAEVDVDTAAYDQGHVPGAVGWNWTTQLCDTLVRDIIPKDKLEELLGSSGIDNDTTDRALRRQQQLVCRVGILAAEAVRPSGCPHHGRRPKEMARRRQGAEHRRRQAPRRKRTRRKTPTTRCARSCRRCRRPSKQEERSAGGRAKPGGIHRRDSRASGTSGNLPAGRTHPRREEHALGEARQR